MDDKCNRYLVFLWYLNDVAEGGETEFCNLDLKVQARSGRLLMFPALLDVSCMPACRHAQTTSISFLRICFFKRSRRHPGHPSHAHRSTCHRQNTSGRPDATGD